MRGPRIKANGPACYHIVSRVVDRRMVLDTNEKERFLGLLRRVERFSAVQILTYGRKGTLWEERFKSVLTGLLRCRVRYFTDGVVLGTRDFVDETFGRHRSYFGPKRETGARGMRGGFGELCTARRLRLDVITVPATG